MTLAYLKAIMHYCWIVKNKRTVTVVCSHSVVNGQISWNKPQCYKNSFNSYRHKSYWPNCNEPFIQSLWRTSSLYQLSAKAFSLYVSSFQSKWININTRALFTKRQNRKWSLALMSIASVVYYHRFKSSSMFTWHHVYFLLSSQRIIMVIWANDNVKCSGPYANEKQISLLRGQSDCRICHGSCHTHGQDQSLWWN